MDSSSKSVKITDAVVGVIATGGTVHISGDITLNLPPPISTFVGRHKETKQLFSLFFEENRKHVVIHGLPGMGKSELAKQFAKRCLNDNRFQKAYWITSKNKVSFENPKYIYEESKEKPCLFILDNAIDKQSVLDFMHDEYFYLITSHSKEWDIDIPAIELGPLRPDSAMDLYKIILKHNYKEEDQALYVEIANIVQCFPIALQITGAFIRQSYRSLDHAFNLKEYVEHLHQSQFELISKELPSCFSNLHNIPFYGVIKECLNKLQTSGYFNYEESVIALKVLYVCSYLDSDSHDINYDTFDTLFKLKELKSEKVFEKVLYILNNFSLITYDGYTISIHQLTQTVLRYDIYKHKDSKIQNNYYAACLEFLFIYNTKFYRKSDKDTIISFLKYADENIITFEAFYNNHKKIILNDLSNSISLDDLLKQLIKYGCKQCIKHIFADLGDKSRECIDKFNLLHEAIRHNHLDLLNWLLQHDVDINNKNENYDSPLHIAAFEWNLTIIQCLLNYNPDLGAKNKYGNTPVFEFFKGARYCKYFKVDEVNNILLNLRFNDYKNVNNHLNQTVLHAAAATCQKELVLLLIKKYCMSVNVQDSNGHTPLHTIFFQANNYPIHRTKIIETVKLLINYNADFNIKDKKDRTPLDIAIIKELDYFVIIFFELDSYDKKYINKYNLLHKIVYYDKLDMLEPLLTKYNIDVNITDENLNTGLHVAAFQWNENAIEYLLTYKADVYLTNKQGNTPLLEFCRGACEHNRININRVNKILNLLQFTKINNIVNNDQETILHVASASLNTEFVKLLLENYDLDVNKIDCRYRTPLYAALSAASEPYATTEKINKITKVLRRSGAYIRHENMTLFECALESVYKFNLLHKEISSNLLEIFSLKFRTDIDVNIEDENMNTLLHTASFHGNLNAIRILIERNAVKTARNKFGNIPLFEFVRGTYNRENICPSEVNEIIDLLYYENIKKIVNNEGRTILHVAATSLNADLVNIFINKYKIDANIESATNETPLEILYSNLYSILKEHNITNNLLRIFETTMQLKLNGASLKFRTDKRSIDEEKSNQEQLEGSQNSNQISNSKLVNADNLQELGIQAHKGPRQPRYATLESRLRTFGNWSVDLIQTPEMLAEAGFYYVGTGDQVRCFHCDGGVRHWDPEDEPWVEHARWFPTCAYVRLIKGQEFIQSCNPPKNIHLELFLIFEDKYIKDIKKIFDNDKDGAKEIITTLNLLHYAIVYNQLEVLKLLLQYNDNVNIKNDQNLTPLHLAALHWNIDAINILLKLGADVNIINDQGRNPVHYFFLGAIKAKNLNKATEIFELLTKSKNISSEK